MTWRLLRREVHAEALITVKKSDSARNVWPRSPSRRTHANGAQAQLAHAVIKVMWLGTVTLAGLLNRAPS